MVGRTKKGKIILAVDLGGSLTKGIAIDKTGKLQFFAVAPEVTHVSDRVLQSYERNSFGGTDFTRWVEYNGEKYVFGKTARNVFQAYNNLKLLKTSLSLIIPKILSLLLLVKEKFNISTKVDLQLGVLLPSAEFISGSKEDFVSSLTAVLNSPVVTSAGEFTVELTEPITCFPEGAGAYLAHSRDHGDELKQINCGVVTLGYRNANFFLSQQGKMGGYNSSNLGFSQIVKTISSYMGIDNSGHLATAIFEATVLAKPEPLQEFIKYRSDRSFVQHDELIDVLKTAIEGYLNTLDNWFSLVMTTYPDRCLFLGGSLDFFQPVLPKYFPSGVELVFHPGYRPTDNLMKKENVYSDIRGLNILEKRFIDCWSFFLFLLDRNPNFRSFANEFIGYLMEATV